MFGKHKRALEHIAKLEAAIAEQDKQIARIETGKELVPQSNYSTVTPGFGGPTLAFAPAQPPKKKPEAYVPVLDEAYFEQRRPPMGFYTPSHMMVGGHYGGSMHYYGATYMGY